MEWVNVSCIDELKALGNFREVSKLVKSEAGEVGKISGRGWQTLYDSIVAFRTTINKFNKNECKDKIENDTKAEFKDKDVNDEFYFTSKAMEYIFYLLELDGEIRMKKLEVTKSHFSSKKNAREWMKNISKEIHPDKCKNSKAVDAMAKLNNMYSSMVKNG